MVEQTVEQVSEAIAKTLRRASAWWLVRAALSIVIGVLVLIWPDKALGVIAFLAGIYFVVLGALRVLEGILAKDAGAAAKTANIVLGALVLVLGVVVARNPELTWLIIVVIVGISWILEGIATVASVATGHGGSWPTVVLGLLVAVAGVLVVVFADGAVIAYAVLIGIALIAVGLLEVVLFFAARSALKRV